MNARLPLTAPTLKIYPHQTLAQATADELGKLQAQIAPLKNKEEALKQLLRDSGLEVVEGDLYRATITTPSATVKTDWEELAKEYIPNEILQRLIPCYQSVSEPGKPRISIKAKKGV